MREITIHRRVAAPVERVWEVATDLAGAPQNLSQVDAVEMLTSGPFGVGTRWRETRTLYGRSATEELTVTAVDPRRSYAVAAESAGVRYVSTFRFASTAAGGTDVTMTFGGEPLTVGARVLGALMGPLMRRSVTRQLTADLADLAAAAERR